MCLTSSRFLLSVGKGLQGERQVVFGGLAVWEASTNHPGVRVQNSIERQTCSFNWVFVHLFNKSN